MKTLVVYESEYGNTEKLARAIAEAPSAQGEARVARLREEVPGLEHDGIDLLVVGAPTQREARK